MTEAERALLIWLAKYFRDSTPADPLHIQRLIVAAQTRDGPAPIITEYPNCTVKTWVGKGERQTPAEPSVVFAPNSMPDTHRFGPKSPEPKPSTAYGKLGGCWNIGSAEPKPSAYGHQEHCNYPGSPCACKEPKPNAGMSVKEPEAIQPWLLDTTVKILKDERYAKQIAEALYGVPVDANAVEVILRAPALLAAKIVEIERISTAKDRDTAKPDPNASQPVSDLAVSAGVSQEALDAACRVFQEAGAILLGSILIREALEAAAPYICKGKDRDTATVIADNDAKMKELDDLARELEAIAEQLRGSDGW